MNIVSQAKSKIGEEAFLTMDRQRNLGLIESRKMILLDMRGLAAIGKNGTQIRLHKKDSVLFCVPFLLENEVH